MTARFKNVIQRVVSAVSLIWLVACGSGGSSSGGPAEGIAGNYRGKISVELELESGKETLPVDILVRIDELGSLVVESQNTFFATASTTKNLDVVAVQGAAGVLLRDRCRGQVRLLINKSTAPQFLRVFWVTDFLRCAEKNTRTDAKETRLDRL